jgi:hypothetical protein
MATYRWRIPMVQAVQFDGKNHDEVKELIGDESEGEEFLIGTGEFEEPEVAVPPPTGEGEQPPAEGEAAPQPPEGGEEAVPVNPDGVGAIPYDPKAKPKEGPVEKTEPLTVAEGDWVVKDVPTGKVEVNPEGFPDEYEFVSS